MHSWKKWRYKNLTYLSLSLIIVIALFRYEPFHDLLLKLGNLGYIGAFFGGMFFVSTFTIAIGSLILFILAEALSPVEIGVVAGMGAVMGDLFIFHFVKDNLMEELRPIYNKLGGNHIYRVLHTPYFSWTLPVVGALIIVSPLPDEVGVSLMGIAKMKTYKFIFLSFILNALGIILVISASTFIKP